MHTCLFFEDCIDFLLLRCLEAVVLEAAEADLAAAGVAEAPHYEEASVLESFNQCTFSI